jgi:UDP-glucose 4-epimerase
MRKASDMILVTGGAGYIGSHVCIALLDAGFDVVAVDNLSNSNKASLERVQSICGRSLVFRLADIRDEEAICEILRAFGVTAVIHLAGLKAVGDSNVRPMTYYENNVLGTMRLVSAMKRANVKTLVFSSSATVYGIPRYLPLDEKHPLGPTNPYGRTKLVIEEMLKDLCRSDDGWTIGNLRYFNPVGAHESVRERASPASIPSEVARNDPKSPRRGERPAGKMLSRMGSCDASLSCLRSERTRPIHGRGRPCLHRRRCGERACQAASRRPRGRALATGRAVQI